MRAPAISGFAVVALQLSTLVSAQNPTAIRVPVRLVTAQTLVFSKEGRFVFGLQPSDFRLYDKGRLQKINLDIEWAPLSLAVAIQANEEARPYLPFIARTGSVIDTSLAGEDGEVAVLTYGDQITLAKRFESGDVRAVLKAIQAAGDQAPLLDAGLRAIELLKQRPSSRTRVLLFIGQPDDRGSQESVTKLAEQAERENVSIYAVALPEFGKKFVSETFSLRGLGSQGYKGGYEASTELTKLIPALKRGAESAAGKDAFSVLTASTGGVQLHFRKQRQLEDAIGIIGTELRSMYLLSFSPDLRESGYHEIKVDVGVPGAMAYSRPGYILSGN
ncbi:MAG: VWA domain-containing protein [Acidobacteriaceae bacterium]|nr:VWA domain-containing protein [Acidobacteriaceae bacterium]MBV9767516.1 VWA domain-containing protein [Acidobacteriaceae bacterium]